MSLKDLLRKADKDLLVTPRHEQWLLHNRNIHVQKTIWDKVSDEVLTPQRDRRSTFSASGMGACMRERIFQFTSLSPVDRIDSSLIAIFHQGTFMHMKWQTELLDSGVLDDIEVPCNHEGLRLTGTVDGTGEVPTDHPLREQHKRFGWELKSINSGGFRWLLDRGPSKAHLLQIHAYMLATGWRVWSLVYENKDTQEWKEFIVHCDQGILDAVVHELEELNAYLNEKRLPPILNECLDHKGAYKKCPFAHECLDTDAWPQEQREPRRIRVA